MATSLIDLIDRVNADDLPTNEFTIEDKDPMVILGKLNEVIAYLETLNETITESDTKATEALENARQAIADATEALSVANGIDAKATQALENAVEAVSTANTALSSASTALSTANSALSTSNTALSTANSALSTANGADSKADEAIETAGEADRKADEAIDTANGIDGKATQALTNSQTAITTANEAKEIAEEALEQVVTEAGTKVYVGGVLQTTFNADTKADLTRVQSLESDVGQAETDIDNLESDVADINTAISGIISKNNTQDAEIQDNSQRINNHATQIAGVVSVNNTQNGRLDTLETMTDDISEELDTQQTSINNLSTTSGNHTLQLITLTNAVNALANAEKVNEQGTGFIRYESGIQICWEKYSKSSTPTINFPKPFIATPAVQVSIHLNSSSQASFRCFGYNITNTGFTTFAGDSSRDGSYIAIGKWK